MGWMFSHRGRQPIKDWVVSHVNCDNESGTWKVLDIAIKNFRTAYMAVEITRKNPPIAPRVVAFVFLLGFRPKDEFDTGYKDMDETMGPYEAECPARILDKLTPTDHEYALQWRAKCRENLAKKVKLEVDQEFRTAPIKFTDGVKRSHFRVAKVRPLQLWCMDTQVVVRLRRKVLLDSIIK